MTTGTVLITGCSTGIGHATAKVFQAKGWNVIATLRRPEDAPDLKALDNVLVTRLDVTDPASIESAIAAGIQRFGDIDVIVNNAGYGLYGVFEGLSDATIRAQYETNVFGVMNTIRAILPRFRAKGSGVIVNISSGGGFFALPTMSIYCSSKFAVEGFSEGIYHELRSIGIKVKLIEPGGVMDTPFDSGASRKMAETTPPSSYQPFIDGTAKIIDGMRAVATATSADVAEVVFAAATDGTDRLRYLATDDIKGLVQLRQGASEEQYMAFMCAHLAPPLG